MNSICVMTIVSSSPSYTGCPQEAPHLPGTSKTFVAPIDETAIGSRIRELRKRQGMTQVELAKELGLNQTAVSDYENGVVRIHAAMLAALAKILRSTPDEILGREKQKKSGKTPDRRFMRRIEKLDRLSPQDQRALLNTIDAFLSRAS